MNTQEFIIKAKEIHGDKYDYSQTNFVSYKEKLTITCKKHGCFLQNPVTHLKGKNCFKCGVEIRQKSQSMGVENFILKATSVHHNKYDYSKVKYKNTSTKITIKCPIHGLFIQTPHDHIKGQGCPQCGKDSSSKLRRSNNEEFIKKANLIHQGIYDYSKVEYLGSKKKVEIICKSHGSFLQSPNAHLTHAQGCPKCWDEAFLLKNPMLDQLVRQKIKSNWKAKSVNDLKDILEKRKATFIEKYGVENPSQHEEIIKKIHQTKKANGSYGKSKIEDNFYLYLCRVFNSDNIERSKIVNGWSIDFYLKQIDVYLQLDGIYYHGLDRPVDQIKQFKTVTDYTIYKTILRDQKQNQWFAENKLKLVRITDQQAEKIIAGEEQLEYK